MPGPGFFFFGDEERKEVEDVLRTGYLSRYGSDDDPRFQHKVFTLEAEFAQAMGARHAVAVNSGTSALMASLVAVGLRPGDEVLVPGYTFIASMSAVIAVGGVPVLVEIDDSLTMDPVDAARKITPRTKVILPVHMLGNPCDMRAIQALARQNNLAIVEDCCQALGGSYDGQRLGTFGQMGAYSLNSYKIINAGDAGILVTSDEELYRRAFAFHDQGHLPLRKGVEIGNRTILGMNMRMNELTGAFALAQLRKLERILGTLREKKARFKALIQSAGLEGVQFRRINDEAGECATLLTIRLESAEQADAVSAALGTKPVIRSGWHVYNNMEHLLDWPGPDGSRPFHKGMLPHTDDLLRRSINLSVGVIDPGLGSEFGIQPFSTEAEIEQAAVEFVRRVKPITG